MSFGFLFQRRKKLCIIDAEGNFIFPERTWSKKEIARIEREYGKRDRLDFCPLCGYVIWDIDYDRQGAICDNYKDDCPLSCTSFYWWRKGGKLKIDVESVVYGAEYGGKT